MTMDYCDCCSRLCKVEDLDPNGICAECDSARHYRPSMTAAEFERRQRNARKRHWPFTARRAWWQFEPVKPMYRDAVVFGAVLIGCVALLTAMLWLVGWMVNR